MNAAERRRADRRSTMRTALYREMLAQCVAYKSAPRHWHARHNGTDIIGTGSTAAKARTDCALKVLAVGAAEQRGLRHEAEQVPDLLAKNRELQDLISKVYWALRDGEAPVMVIDTIERYDRRVREQRA